MIYLGIGLFVALFAWSVTRFLYLRWRGVVTTGTVVALARNAEGEGGSFVPMVAFSTREGERIEAKSGFGTPASTFFRVGEQVTVRYLAKRPTCFDIVGYEVWTVVLFFVLAGGAVAYFYWGTAE